MVFGRSLPGVELRKLFKTKKKILRSYTLQIQMRFESGGSKCAPATFRAPCHTGHIGISRQGIRELPIGSARSRRHIICMVLRRAASSAACLLVHRSSAFTPPCGRSILQGLPPSRQVEVLAHRHRKHRLRGVGGRSVAGMPTTKESTTSSDVFAFDFDGVICNSQGESSRSGFKALKRIWPKVSSRFHAEHGGHEDDDAPAWMVDKMRELRPIVETGYENILLVRLLIEEKMGQSVPFASNELLDTWGPDARDELTALYGLNKDELIEAFGQARDHWMENDFSGWLGANSFYERVREAIAAAEGEVFVVTTKQQRFASALLKHAGVQVPLDRIFGLGTGPKPDVLTELKAKHGESAIHFFEDRVETLELVCADKRLEEGIKLYLCDWGFNTATQRARGEANPRVRVIGTGDIGGILAPHAEGAAADKDAAAAGAEPESLDGRR